MATRTAVNPKWRYNTDDAARQVALSLNVDTAATYLANGFLRLTSDGDIKEATSGAALGVGVDAITHQAITDRASAPGVTTVYDRFYIITPEDVFEMNEYDTTIAKTDIGVRCGINVTSNICTVDISDTTNPQVVLVNPLWAGRDVQDDSTDTLARCYVRVLDTCIDANPDA